MSPDEKNVGSYAWRAGRAGLPHFLHGDHFSAYRSFSQKLMNVQGLHWQRKHNFLSPLVFDSQVIHCDFCVKKIAEKPSRCPGILTSWTLPTMTHYDDDEHLHFCRSYYFSFLFLPQLSGELADG